jgi:hypothetical protein
MNPAAVVHADSAAVTLGARLLRLAAMRSSFCSATCLGAVGWCFSVAAVRVAIAALFCCRCLRGLLPVLRQHWRKTFFVGLLNAGIRLPVTPTLLSIQHGSVIYPQRDRADVWRAWSLGSSAEGTNRRQHASGLWWWALWGGMAASRATARSVVHCQRSGHKPRLVP